MKILVIKLLSMCLILAVCEAITLEEKIIQAQNMANSAIGLDKYNSAKEAQEIETEIVEAEVVKTEVENIQSPVVKKEENKLRKYDEELIGGLYFEDKELLKEIDNNLDKIESELSKTRVQNFENSQISLFTDDAKAHTTMIKIIKRAQNFFSENFSQKNEVYISFKNPIILKVIGNQATPFENAVIEGDDVILQINYTEDLELGEFVDLLTLAMLKKLSNHYYGVKLSDEIPYWFYSAYSRAFEQSLSFGLASDYAQLAKNMQMPTLKELFNFENDGDNVEDKKVLSLMGLYAIKALLGVDDFKVFNRMMLKEPQKALEYLISKNYDDLYFKTLMYGEIYSRLGGIYDFENSELEIERLAIVQTSDINDERVGIFGDDVWKFREYPKFRKDLENRLLEIKLHLQKINPVYYNVLIELGKLYEAALEDEEDDFIQAKKTFGQSLIQAREISNISENMLKNK